MHPAADLIVKLAARGIALRPREGTIRAIGPLTDADRATILAHRDAILAELVDNGDDLMTEADNEFYWSQISRADFEYLTVRRHYPDPCFGCGGRLNHSQACEAMILATRIPFGRHKNENVGKAPLDQLRWLVARRGLPEDVRYAIQLRLKKETSHGH
jgi:hypothetical protein